ncbi:hypothetical protein ACTXT7_001440 [Hymenolepis weldensis]
MAIAGHTQSGTGKVWMLKPDPEMFSGCILLFSLSLSRVRFIQPEESSFITSFVKPIVISSPDASN